eukprot:CAMPEP_0119040898 /NCGR_PEP_ID=MMETSP1177-20130426/10963_1 /TAXON_ID=2985 /ORGANISM="Ochromonas sp, Strain CCMP1899" /LENGTH=545 /DNA_ID=CAMNT_0007006417 /DNA_START=354 /DNA_END=1991 /DNA_ORIENTATION=-
MEAPRLYLSSKKILDNIKKLGADSGKLGGKATYIFNRIVMVKKPLIEGVSFNVSLLPLNEDVYMTESKSVEGVMRGVYYVGEPVLGLLPNFKREDDVSPTDLMLEWGVKLELFKLESEKFQEHTKKAGKYCKATEIAFTIFLQCFKHKTYPEDAVGVSIPRRRWCKAIRMQLLRGHVKRITEMLDRRESERLKLEGIVEGSERLQDSSNKPIGIEPPSKPTTEDNNLNGELRSEDMTPKSPGMFVLPVMNVKMKSTRNFISCEDPSPLCRQSSSSILTKGTPSPSPSISRQPSFNARAGIAAVEPSKTEITDMRSLSIDVSAKLTRRSSRRYASMELRRAPSVESHKVTTMPCPLELASSSSNLMMDSESSKDSGIGLGTKIEESQENMSLVLPQFLLNKSASGNFPVREGAKRRVGSFIKSNTSSRNLSISDPDSSPSTPTRHLSRANSIILSAATQAALAMVAAQRAVPSEDSDDVILGPDPGGDVDLDSIKSGDVTRQSSMDMMFPILPSILLPIEEGPVQSEEGVVAISPTSLLPKINHSE